MGLEQNNAMFLHFLKFFDNSPAGDSMSYPLGPNLPPLSSNSCNTIQTVANCKAVFEQSY